MKGRSIGVLVSQKNQTGKEMGEEGPRYERVLGKMEAPTDDQKYFLVSRGRGRTRGDKRSKSRLLRAEVEISSRRRESKGITRRRTKYSSRKKGNTG